MALIENITLGNINSCKTILKCSKGQKIEKLCGGSEWQPRILYVTADKLLIVHPDQENLISDQIPLVMESMEIDTLLRNILTALFCCIISMRFPRRTAPMRRMEKK